MGGAHRDYRPWGMWLDIAAGALAGVIIIGILVLTGVLR